VADRKVKPTVDKGEALVRKLANRVTAPFRSTLRNLERLGLGDTPGAKRLRTNIAEMKARMGVSK